MILAVYLIGAFTIGAAIFFLKNRFVNFILSVMFVLGQISLAAYAWLHIGESDSTFFSFDALGVLLSLVLALLTVTTFYHSHLYLKRHKGNVRTDSIFVAALILLNAGMTGAYFADHLGVLWALIEATTLFVSVLIYHKRSEITLEATWKYLFVCSIGIAIAFIGILFMSIVASQEGMVNLNISLLVQHASEFNTMWLKIAFALVVTGFSVKFGSFPLFPVGIDAKGVAPDPVAGLMSTALVNMGFVGIYRIYTVIAQSSAHAWADRVLMIVGIASISIAAIQLLKVKHFKRMFAFSSLEHMGIVALGLAVGGIGYYAAILHLVLHSLVKAALFFQIGQVDSIFHSYWIKKTGNYMHLNPRGALVVVLAFVCVTAMPPSGLFVSELMVFRSLFAGGHYFVAVLALFMLTLIVYVFGKNLFHLLYSRNEVAMKITEVSIKKSETISQFLLLGIVVWLGFFQPQFLTDLINNAISILSSHGN